MLLKLRLVAFWSKKIILNPSSTCRSKQVIKNSFSNITSALNFFISFFIPPSLVADKQINPSFHRETPAYGLLTNATLESSFIFELKKAVGENANNAEIKNQLYADLFVLCPFFFDAGYTFSKVIVIAMSNITGKIGLTDMYRFKIGFIGFPIC